MELEALDPRQMFKLVIRKRGTRCGIAGFWEIEKVGTFDEAMLDRHCSLFVWFPFLADRLTGARHLFARSPKKVP